MYYCNSSTIPCSAVAWVLSCTSTTLNVSFSLRMEVHLPVCKSVLLLTFHTQGVRLEIITWHQVCDKLPNTFCLTSIEMTWAAHSLLHHFWLIHSLEHMLVKPFLNLHSIFIWQWCSHNRLERTWLLSIYKSNNTYYSSTGLSLLPPDLWRMKSCNFQNPDKFLQCQIENSITAIFFLPPSQCISLLNLSWAVA